MVSENPQDSTAAQWLPHENPTPSSSGSTPAHPLPDDLEQRVGTDSSMTTLPFTMDEGQLLRSTLNDTPYMRCCFLETQAV